MTSILDQARKLGRQPLQLVFMRTDWINGLCAGIKAISPETNRRVVAMTKREQRAFLSSHGWVRGSSSRWFDPVQPNDPHVLSVAVRVAMYREVEKMPNLSTRGRRVMPEWCCDQGHDFLETAIYEADGSWYCGQCRERRRAIERFREADPEEVTDAGA